MISARKFCQEPGYPVTIFLTYSFDPLFFERVPLDDLSMGGTRRILVLADAGEIAEAMKRCAGQVFHLGRTYTLAEARASNLFHPKMIVRLSPDGGRVWIGSGNLTYTGWGGNHELATAWSIGPGSDDAGTWLPDILRAVASVTSSEAFRSQIGIVHSSIPWLMMAEGDTARSPVLLGMPNRPLAQQLVRRWEGRRFTTVKLFTGSTDVDGAFLLWAHKNFGVKKATVCLTPSFASFDAKQLAKLPMDVRFVERDPKRRVHAKLYWFSGPNGDAAVMGSANCSAAAWLASHDNGNVELITVYDTPEPAAFAPILSDFDGDELLPKDVLGVPVKPMEPLGDERVGLAYRITSIRLRASGRTIDALLEPMPQTEDVNLVIETKRATFHIPMRVLGARLVGRLSEDMSLGVEPVFATMEISSGSGVVRTPARWLDNERALENAARDRHVDPSHEIFLGRGFGGASEQRMMEAISAISLSLLNFETPDLVTFPKKRDGQNKTEADKETDNELARPVDPSTLTYSLNDQTDRSKALTSDSAMNGVSLHGVMKMLFTAEEEHEPEIDLSQERWSAYEPEKYEPDEEPDDDANSRPKQISPRSDAEALKALREHIDQFLSELAKPSFAERCPASTLAQAAVFPILLGIKGQEEGWLDDDMLASIACRVVSVMFAKSYGFGKPIGLFQQVRARYVAAEKQAEFLEAVADGALYTVLLAALMKPEAHSIANLIQQADAIHTVMACSDLVMHSDGDQRATLAGRVIIRNMPFSIEDQATKIAASMKRLVACLQVWDRLNPGQTDRTRLHRAGSILWSAQGWELTPRTPVETYCGGVALDEVLMDDGNIQLAVDELWQMMREGRSLPSPEESER